MARLLLSYQTEKLADLVSEISGPNDPIVKAVQKAFELMDGHNDYGLDIDNGNETGLELTTDGVWEDWEHR